MTSASAFALLPPGLVLILGGFLLPFLQRRERAVLVLGLPLIVLWLIWQLPDGPSLTMRFLDWDVTIVEADALSRVFATIFAIMAFGGGLFALNQRRVVELVAAFVYAGSAIGVALSGDLISMFLFWEVMAIGSTLVVWSSDQPGAYKSSVRYLAVHLAGGVVLMVGIILYIQQTGSIDFVAMKTDSLATWLILIGFLVNAGAPPFSSWLPDAYPEASFSGTVFLSAFTTKTAVYVLIRGFPGAEVLIFFGCYMIMYGIMYALLENDLRRILAYSIINQVGFMVTGVGIGTEMALNGATAHAFTHIIYKALLLMSAGAIIYSTRDDEFPNGRRKCTDVGGLFQSMPLTAVCGTIGALAISSFPWTSGFVSKAMINDAAAAEHMTIVWFWLAAASAGVFLHAGIKYPWYAFFQNDKGLRPTEPPWNMRAAMVLFAFLCIAIGVVPGPLYDILPYPVDYEPYTAAHVVNMLQLLLFAGLAFFVLLPVMKRTLTITLDTDWFYRAIGKVISVAVWESMRHLSAQFRQGSTDALRGLANWVARFVGPGGVLAKTSNAGVMVAWVLAFLILYLVLYYR